MRKETTVIHPVFGAIRLNDKFSKVLKLKPFNDLAFKSQLGSKALSREILNAKHSRLTHSVGVMYLTRKLLDTCERKFSKYFSITKEEREILELVALGHDIGHIAFSHSLENKTVKTHEERTVELFESYADQINEIFGYDITSSVVSVFRNNVEVKKKGIENQTVEKLNIIFVFTNLLMGAIDCDRMEYIITDRYMVWGEKLDFTSIFEYITIVLLNDSPVIGFEEAAVPIIENMLISRFDQYARIYFDKDCQVSEIALQKYLQKQNFFNEKKEEITEFEILSQLYNILEDSSDKNKNSQNYRLAEIILNGERKDLLIKAFTNEKEYVHFMERIYAITKRKDIIACTQKKVSIYDPQKNRIYIKDNDGMVRDITEVSVKIREYSVDLYLIVVDISATYCVEEKEAKRIRALFESNPIEIEKKFEISKGTNLNVSWDKRNFRKELKNIFAQMNGIEYIGEFNIVNNDDIYFNSNCPIPNNVKMRYRKTNNNEVYFVKIPLDDGTSITKREEYEYKGISFQEFLKLTSSLFKIKGFISKDDSLVLSEGIKIRTERYKLLITVCESIIEIACDFSIYEYKGKIATDEMLECELKEGDDLALWCLTNHLKKFGFIEIVESKETRARKALEITK